MGASPSTVVSVDAAGSVTHWVADVPASLRRLSGPVAAPASVAATEDAAFVLWRDDQGQPRLEIVPERPDVEARRVRLVAPAPVEALALSPSGSLAVLACDDGQLHCLDVLTGRLEWSTATPTVNAHGLAVAGDARRAVIAFADGSVRAFDRETAAWHVVHEGLPIQAVAISPDGETVLIVDARGNVIRRDGFGEPPYVVMTLDAVADAMAVGPTGDWAAIALRDGRLDVHRVSGEQPIDEDVRFTVYRPKVIQPDRWASLLVFAHKTDLVVDPVRGPVDPTEEVQARARSHFGQEPVSSVAEDSGLGLALGSTIRIVPDFPGIRCNPESAELRWFEAIHETQFRLLAGSELAGTRVRGAVRVWCGSLIVAELAVTLAVATPHAEADQTPAVDSLTRYRKIFPSYSHADRSIVAGFQTAARALGDEFLQDVLTLRAGEDWSARLLELIESADVFQLFWSRNSMRSEYCRAEWEHALSLHRPLFIRPVYWEDPLPEEPQLDLPPSGLRALHFVRVPVARPPAPVVAYVVCSVCGQQNARTEAFCLSCGSFLEWSAAHVPTPSGAAPAPSAPAPPQSEAATTPPPAAPRLERPRAPSSATRPRTPLPGQTRCPQCGEPNDAIRRFCRRCGGSLDSQSKAGSDSAAPTAGEPAQRSARGRTVPIAVALLVALVAALVVAWVVSR